MHLQRRRPSREPQAVTLERFAVKVDVEALRGLDLNPWQAGADEHAIESETIGQQVLQGADQLLRCRQNADVE
ncbi:hypothetical protein D3C75_1123200 [compost metagenome]